MIYYVPPAHNFYPPDIAVVPLKNGRYANDGGDTLRRDLQHAGACIYNNYLAPPAHNFYPPDIAVVP